MLMTVHRLIEPGAWGAERLGPLVTALRNARNQWRVRQDGRRAISRFPQPRDVQLAVETISGALFPRRLGSYSGDPATEDAWVAAELGRGLALLTDQVAAEQDYWQAETPHPFDPDQAEQIVAHFAEHLPDVRAAIDADVEAAFAGDPAARSVDEILISYPGAHAILYHRLAHPLYNLGAVIVARVISELANARTGIDIHPGATIGPRFFIDHGTGVVIGETTVIGANVRLYQHVTLGARSPAAAMGLTLRERFARHPVIGDDVVIYAGATLLGRIHIGDGATVGGNVWLLEDVPAGAVVVQPGAVRLDGEAAIHVAAALKGARA